MAKKQPKTGMDFVQDDLQVERMCEMLQTVWAVIHDGKIEPLEGIAFPEGAKVIVTWLPEEDDAWFWLSASETSLTEVWENTEDDIYAELLQG